MSQVKYQISDSLGRVVFVFRVKNRDVLCPPAGTYTAEPESMYNIEPKVCGFGFHMMTALNCNFLLGLTLFNHENQDFWTAKGN